MSVTHPIVLRIASMFPSSMSRMQMHAKRRGGPLDHVEKAFFHRNRTYFGENFVDEVNEEILQMKKDNRTAEEDALKAQKRQKQAKERKELGLVDPWKSSQDGPLREVVLTTNVDYFRAPAEAPDDKVMITYGINDQGETVEHRLCREKIDAFEQRGKLFFETYFSVSLRHLRFDCDEETPHFHALLLQKTKKVTKRRGEQHLIQPTSHKMLKNYEYAQDIAGAFFAPIGLCRGQNHAAKRRAAKLSGNPASVASRHQSPREYREKWQRNMREKEDTLRRKEHAIKSDVKVLAFDQAKTELELKHAKELREVIASERLSVKENLAEAKREKDAADSYAKAMKTGIDAIEERKIDYRPETGGKTEGLNYGPAAPEDKTAREKLAQAIMPAFGTLVAVARKFFGLRQREEKLVRAEAENARQASVLRTFEKNLRKKPSSILEAIENGMVPDTYDEMSFPDALAIEKGTKREEVFADCDKLSNVALRIRYRATYDAVLLCDNNPKLREKYRLGVKALKMSAEFRGLNLSTGKHDPRKATDPKRANLHTDTDLRPAKARRGRGQRQRER